MGRPLPPSLLGGPCSFGLATWHHVAQHAHTKQDHQKGKRSAAPQYTNPRTIASTSNNTAYGRVPRRIDASYRYLPCEAFIDVLSICAIGNAMGNGRSLLASRSSPRPVMSRRRCRRQKKAAASKKIDLFSLPQADEETSQPVSPPDEEPGKRRAKHSRCRGGGSRDRVRGSRVLAIRSGQGPREC